MKNILQLLGISVRELTDLLFVSEQTLHTWFNRKKIPLPHYTYIAALEKYQQQKNEADLEQISTQWESENQAFLQTQKTEALKELQLYLQQSTLAWQKLKLKENRLLNRLHLAQNYPQYLAPELQNSENLQTWCNHIYRRSNFDLGDVRKAIQKLEQKIAGLEAEIAYWEG
jgi:hypothetical protein